MGNSVEIVPGNWILLHVEFPQNCESALRLRLGLDLGFVQGLKLGLVMVRIQVKVSLWNLLILVVSVNLCSKLGDLQHRFLQVIQACFKE